MLRLWDITASTDFNTHFTSYNLSRAYFHWKSYPKCEGEYQSRFLKMCEHILHHFLTNGECTFEYYSFEDAQEWELMCRCYDRGICSNHVMVTTSTSLQLNHKWLKTRIQTWKQRIRVALSIFSLNDCHDMLKSPESHSVTSRLYRMYI